MAMAMVMAMVTDGGDSRLEWLVGSEKVSRKKKKKERERMRKAHVKEDLFL